MDKYARLDEQIIAAIGRGGAMSPLYDRLVNIEAYALAEPTMREPFRVIDGRLQALRKRGLIRYKAGKWEVCK